MPHLGRKHLRFHLTALLIALHAPFAVASDNGTELLAHCQVAERFADTGELKDSVALVRCIALLNGVHDTMQFLSVFMGRSTPYRSCFPDESVSKTQIMRIVLKYLRANPERLHEPNTVLAIRALHQAFPCQK